MVILTKEDSFKMFSYLFNIQIFLILGNYTSLLEQKGGNSAISDLFSMQAKPNMLHEHWGGMQIQKDNNNSFIMTVSWCIMMMPMVLD